MTVRKCAWFGRRASWFSESDLRRLPSPAGANRFGWDVGEGSRRDSAGGQPGPEEVAERPSQAPNGSAARLARLFSRDERTWRKAKRAGAKSAQVPSPIGTRVGHGNFSQGSAVANLAVPKAKSFHRATLPVVRLVMSDRQNPTRSRWLNRTVLGVGRASLITAWRSERSPRSMALAISHRASLWGCSGRLWEHRRRSATVPFCSLRAGCRSCACRARSEDSTARGQPHCNSS
jgi:hypothetical protein